MTAFVPKQCIPLNPVFFTQLSGDTTKQIAEHLLKLIPAIPTGSIIHDNACGTGAMTEAIMETRVNTGVETTPHDITIFATDIVRPVIEQMRKRADEKKWPLEAVEFMPSEALTFLDGSFTHSFTNLGIMVMDRDIDAAKQIYRTLKKGGIAVLSIWDKPLPVQAVTAAHLAVRPEGTQIPPAIKRGGFDDTNLRMILHTVGFRSIEFQHTYAVLEVNDLRKWASAAWSFLGCPATGWTAKDEDSWELAIDIMVEYLEKYKGYQKLGDGRVTVIMPAHVAIAAK
ncbi:S-adenosyl-L-methionine-dependent methyltransferase [Lojkania enalia]|uniref:S-adenosyl-L-methionine-dependent methyltransferase n=1 Tax=Lojkania enalia TaxID=147567 RepID=A0A9P4N9N8_9PLEO|nr:S-adenosyl-L-methionine-dependent methyltransferase [Didymosphaeria enalia]